MSDDIKDIIADTTNRVSQYETWANSYHDPSEFMHKLIATMIKEANKLLAKYDKDFTEMDSSEQQNFTSEMAQHIIALKVTMSTLKNDEKGVPSPMRKGGASKINPVVLSVYNGLTKHFTDGLLPAIEAIWPVLGETARVSSAQNKGQTYIEAGLSASDYTAYLVNRIVDNPTKGANRIHAKGFTTEELSNAEFLAENNLFNRLYLTTGEDQELVTQEIDGVTMFVLGRTMVNAKSTGDNS